MIIEELKVRAGFGGVKLEIEIPEKDFLNDELLQGRINILGGKVIQKIDQLQLRLIREWFYEYYGMGMDYQPGMDRCPFTPGGVRVQSQYEPEEDKGDDEIYNVDLETDIEVEPKQKITFPFEIDISKIQEDTGVHET